MDLMLSQHVDMREIGMLDIECILASIQVMCSRTTTIIPWTSPLAPFKMGRPGPIATMDRIGDFLTLENDAEGRARHFAKSARVAVCVIAGTTTLARPMPLLR
jgi:hypothetical protein